MPQRVTLGTSFENVLSLGQDTVKEVPALGQCVPLAKSLQQLLENNQCWDLIFGPKPQKNNDYIEDYSDGKVFKEHIVAQQFSNPLIFELYEDDCEFVNPLGSYVKKHKMTNVYWSLLNLPPFVRSSLKSIFLVGCAKAMFIKQFGFRKLLSNFVQTIKVLESTEGLTIHVDGKPVILHGTLLCVCGDGLAMNGLGGFKEGIGFAKRPCRNCMLLRTEMDVIYLESEMPLRTKEEYAAQVQALKNPNLSKKERDSLSVSFGLSDESVLCELKYFDITRCLPQDFMHNIMEGCLEAEMRAMLNQLIEIDSMFSYNDLNYFLKMLDYPVQFSRDKPSVIDRRHVIDGKLRQSASQMMCLMAILPFALANFVNEQNKFYSNFLLLCQISNVLLAYKVKKSSIAFLRNSIFLHHSRYIKLYGSMTPKFHFLSHAPSVIENLGPCRETWCMRFEGRHAWFSKVATYTNNFKNLEMTLSTRHQIRKCLDFGFGDKTKIVLGEKLFSWTKGENVDKSEYMLGTQISILLQSPVEDNYLRGAVSVCEKNFELRHNSVVLLEDSDYDLPVFGNISALFVYNSRCAAVISVYETVCFDFSRNAYEVFSKNTFKCVLTSQLPTLQSLPKIKIDGKSFVILTYYDRNEICG